ncbi:hypothetical protein TOL5_39450 [Acinetobacter sp. Tol 5]|nr:hypothetical protein TOL5_39450 [Acinetobacter sp. Tol 5]
MDKFPLIVAVDKKFGATIAHIILNKTAAIIVIRKVNIFQPKYDNRPKRPFAFKPESWLWKLEDILYSYINYDIFKKLFKKKN